MKISSYIKLKTLFFLTILLICSNFSINAQQSNLGKVSGVIFDQQDAIILGTEVTIENQNFRKTVMPNSDDGKFYLELPAGIYTITTKQNSWFPTKRGAFLVKPNETTTINLSPTICVLSIALEITSKGLREPVEYNKKTKLEEFLPFSDSPLNIVIEYRKRKSKGSIIEYENAKFTYNNLSVLADILRFDKKKLLIEAKGNVTTDENGHRQKQEVNTIKISEIKNE